MGHLSCDVHDKRQEQQYFEDLTALLPPIG
jgi:hypothetical protein